MNGRGLEVEHAGDGFSPRAEDAVLHGCVPVVIMDHVDPVFASALDWDNFSVRVQEVGNTFRQPFSFWLCIFK